MFLAFTSGAKEMDNRQLAKFSKDTRILDKKLTSTDVDIDFSKVKTIFIRCTTPGNHNPGLPLQNYPPTQPNTTLEKGETPPSQKKKGKSQNTNNTNNLTPTTPTTNAPKIRTCRLRFVAHPVAGC